MFRLYSLGPSIVHMLDFLFLTSISVTFSQVLFISFFISSWFSSLLWSIQPVFLTVPIEVFTHPCVPSNLTLISELFFLCFPVLSGCIFFSPCKKNLCLNLYRILFISWIKKGFFPSILGRRLLWKGQKWARWLSLHFLLLLWNTHVVLSLCNCFLASQN